MKNKLLAVAAWYKRQHPFVQVLLYGLDLAVNTLLPKGEIGETVSENMAERAKEGDPLGVAVCKVLDTADPGHCDRADSPSH